MVCPFSVRIEGFGTFYGLTELYINGIIKYTQRELSYKGSPFCTSDRWNLHDKS